MKRLLLEASFSETLVIVSDPTPLFRSPPAIGAYYDAGFNGFDGQRQAVASPVGLRRHLFFLPVFGSGISLNSCFMAASRSTSFKSPQSILFMFLWMHCHISHSHTLISSMWQ